MAFLFCDSFDHYDTATQIAKWNTVTNNAISACNGRRSSQSCRFTNGSANIIKVLTPGDNTIIVGVALKTANMNPFEIIQVYQSGANQMCVALKADGALEVRRSNKSGTLLGTSAAGLVTTSTYGYIELKALISTTVGTAEVRFNGAVVLTLTGLNNAQAAVSTWNGVGSNGAGSTTYDLDDFYVCDGTGAAPWNTYLGDIRVDHRMPTGVGTTTQWTPSAGANWQCVDEVPPNGDTDYNSTTVLNNIDTFVVQDAPVVGAAILAVQQCTYMKKSDTGTVQVAPVVRSDGVDFVRPTVTLATAYAFGLEVLPTDPDTSAQWLEAAFNAAEFGYKRIA